MAAWRSTQVQASGQWRAIPILLSAVLIALLAPGASPSSLAQPSRRDPPKRITVWFHGGLGQAFLVRCRDLALAGLQPLVALEDERLGLGESLLA